MGEADDSADVAAADIVVRGTTAEDVIWAEPASALIEEASRTFDMATRAPDFLAQKIAAGKAALALRPAAGPPAGDTAADGQELVGFGYWSEWEGGAFVSHSGLVVSPAARGRGLGRRLKTVLFESSRSVYPDAAIMSLTTSEAVKAMNLSLGFRMCGLHELTDDPAFWAACEDCRNFEEARAAGRKCCNDGMILLPGDPAP